MGKPSKFGSLERDRRISNFGQRTFTTALVLLFGMLAIQFVMLLSTLFLLPMSMQMENGE